MDKLTAIKYFCMAAQTLNFREVSEKLMISPSVITRIINELESELGEPLFKRNTRCVHLTDFGQAFLPKARQWLNDSEQLFQNSKANEELKGIVRITAPAWRDNDAIITELLTALEPYPELIIDWRDDMAKLDNIAHNIDIGIRIGLQPDPNFIIRPIAQIGDLLVATPELIQRLGLPKDLNELCRNYPFVGQINASTGRMWDLYLNENTSLEPQKIAFLSNDMYSGFQAVLHGKAVGLFNEILCKPYLEQGKLQVLFPEIPIQKWQLFLYRPYQSIKMTRVLKVFDLLTEILRRKFANLS